MKKVCIITTTGNCDHVNEIIVDVMKTLLVNEAEPLNELILKDGSIADSCCANELAKIPKVDAYMTPWENREEFVWIDTEEAEREFQHYVVSAMRSGYFLWLCSFDI